MFLISFTWLQAFSVRLAGRGSISLVRSSIFVLGTSIAISGFILAALGVLALPGAIIMLFISPEAVLTLLIFAVTSAISSVVFMLLGKLIVRAVSGISVKESILAVLGTHLIAFGLLYTIVTPPAAIIAIAYTLIEGFTAGLADAAIIASLIAVGAILTELISLAIFSFGKFMARKAIVSLNKAQIPNLSKEIASLPQNKVSSAAPTLSKPALKDILAINLPSQQLQLEARAPPSITTVENLSDLKKSFELSTSAMQQIVASFKKDMKQGLSGQPSAFGKDGLEGQESSLAMLPTFVDNPTGKEKGKFLSLDLGGTNFRVLMVDLKGDGSKPSLTIEKFKLTKEHISTTAEVLFDAIASFVKKFLVKHNLTDTYDLGFTFSFPVNQIDIDKGISTMMSKGFTVKGIVGEDVVAL
ncbi:MAG: hexokinase family protein, partial [Candidatus Omnitrophota bacterium]